MPELRWTLLILGALFIGGLALWELRRQRHARGEQIAQRDGERVQPTFDDGDSVRDSAEPRRGDLKAFREPTLTFPEVTDRAPIANPPVMDMDDPSLAGLRVDSATAVDEFSSSAPEMAPRVEPMVPRLSAADDEWQEKTSALSTTDEAIPLDGTASPRAPGSDADDLNEPGHDARRSARGDHRADARRRSEAADGAGSGDDADADADADAESDALDSAAEHTSASSSESSAPFVLSENALEDVEPIVDWPDEDVRKIIALRLVSAPGERFQGRAVRLALTAEGFRLGKFEIFHKPGPDARAVLSAASLTKPGTFSLATMDAQRFGGLSLFAVLPGPLSPVATFDELLITARNLNNRLRGALQDERGEPLTPVRSAALRDGLTAAATAAAPVVGPPA